MTRFVDILSWHESGVPFECVEHEGDEPERDGVTRLTAEEYRSREPDWKKTFEAWSFLNKQPENIIELPSLSATKFFYMIVKNFNLNPEAVESELMSLIKLYVTDFDEQIKTILSLKKENFFEFNHPVVKNIAAALRVDENRLARMWQEAISA